MNIFVTVGNHPSPFNRLIRKIDQISKSSEHTFFIQTGKSDYHPINVNFIEFMDSDEMKNRLINADIIITHGGWGTIEECLELGKKVIAVPRIMGIEHFHSQDDIVIALEKSGNILGVYDINKLEEAIEISKVFNPIPLKKGSAKEIILKFINSK